jgi:hypothetical protein
VGAKEEDSARQEFPALGAGQVGSRRDSAEEYEEIEKSAEHVFAFGVRHLRVCTLYVQNPLPQ